MWTPSRAKPASHRTHSIHSIARPVSMISPRQQPQQSQGYDDDDLSDMGSDDEQFPSRVSNTAPLTWNRPQAGSPANLMAQKMQSQAAPLPQVAAIHYQNQQNLQQRPVDDDASSRSSTLDGGADDDSYPTKTPVQTVIKMSLTGTEPASPAPAPHIPGPLESQLAALMSKLIQIEQSNPAASVTPEEFSEMKNRLKALEDEKKVWWKRHEAIWALRDEDVENNIKIRGMLAAARRELDATKKLRDEDLQNVQIVRFKLAEKTRELDRVQAQTGRSSPSRTRISSFIERRDTTDLFTAAKVAALEQRALELERRNSDLMEQLGSQNTSLDDLNRTTAHQAWRATVADLEAKLQAKDAEIQRLRSSAGDAPAGGVQMDWYRIEALLEEHASYREGIGGKLQALRSEKEILMRDLHRKENECQGLELKVQMLQRRANVV
ncbi:uncharacterized protein SETTUDRAFT_174014 [Exserohilum turcica Et28A]|uniref:Uncharacterized protein n=1 Tax=Exserohilum turcicum (strain 28A) TaxID=671987 RepID=R0JUQ1_EXST2|nr:uncharacterized protein SETTUDRAFT_174014 [Exserohilum turcica Et28A]EOA81234.1 hypothetical protein SETTUDRAFT_174014 [Exserohilum turcica Et28A]